MRAVPRYRKDQTISARIDGATNLCACGCGGVTSISQRSNNRWGHIKGMPVRFIAGHSGKHSEPQVRYSVEDRGYVSPCWVASRVNASTGYGNVMFEYRNLLTHRVLYERRYGPIPKDLQTDHLCRVRACCNPDHVEPVTQLVNLHRGAGTKLTEEEALAIRVSLEPQHTLASRYGVTQQTISDIQTGRRWKSLTASTQRREGETHRSAKLTLAQVAEIRQLSVGKRGERTQLARAFGVSAVTIGEVIRGVTWGKIRE